MQNAFTAGLNDWLSINALPPADEDADGWVQFSTPGGLSLVAEPLEHRALHIVASPGYMDASALRAVLEADDEDSPPPHEDRLPVMTWCVQGVVWTAEVDRTDGLVLLTHTAQAPELADEWAERVRAVEQTYAGWAATLSPVPLVFDDIEPRDAGPPIPLLAIVTMRA